MISKLVFWNLEFLKIQDFRVVFKTRVCEITSLVGYMTDLTLYDK